jgi:hypothetical protein
MINFEFKIQDNIKYQYKGELIILRNKNLNAILNLIANNILNIGVNKNGYVEINNTKFRSAYKRYEPYLSYLLTNGLVERDYYIKTKKAYGYRFTEIFKETIEISKIYYSSCTNTKSKIQKYHPDMSISSSVYERLKNDFLSADVIYNPQKEQLEKTKDEWGNFYDIQKWLYNNSELFKWSKGYVFFKWSSKRLYTNFVKLSSHIRTNNIQLNNEKIVEFDIKSSFPLMFAQYCLDVKPELYHDYDFKSYCTSVIYGKFYDELMRGLNSIRNTTKGDHESDFSTRLLSQKEAKTLFQIYLNGNKNKVHYLNGIRCDINKYMEFQYPSIHEILGQIKDDGKKPYDELVQVETRTVFEVIEELYDTYNDIRILTCHDAIYVPELYETKTRTIWEQHLGNIKSILPIESDVKLDTSTLESLGIFWDDD